MGVFYGFIFGMMDMEDVNLRLFKNRFIKEEYYCLPIGIVCGAIIGLAVVCLDNNVSLKKINNYRSQLKSTKHFVH